MAGEPAQAQLGQEPQAQGGGLQRRAWWIVIVVVKLRFKYSSGSGSYDCQEWDNEWALEEGQQ